MEYLKSTLKILDSSTSKITQKRKAANELLETLLESKRSIIIELNNNHLTKTSISWDNVLRVCQRYIIGEADRCIESERLGKAQPQRSDLVIINCRILATRVIEHASSSGKNRLYTCTRAPIFESLAKLELSIFSILVFYDNYV